VPHSESQSGSLDDFTYRRYAPVQGRWISPEPAGLAAADPTTPQTGNRYAYVMNQPLTFVDPVGLCDLVVTWYAGTGSGTFTGNDCGIPNGPPPPGCMWITTAGSGEGSGWAGMQCGSGVGAPPILPSCPPSGCPSGSGGGGGSGTPVPQTPINPKVAQCVQQGEEAFNNALNQSLASANQMFQNNWKPNIDSLGSGILTKIVTRTSPWSWPEALAVAAGGRATWFALKADVSAYLGALNAVAVANLTIDNCLQQQ
jgi:RHS repeat-associated protein